MASNNTEENTTPAPYPNEFVIAHWLGYAFTDIELAEAAEFIMTKLEPIKLEDLDPDNRLCAICHEELFVSEDVKRSHDPVKTICGHIFGKKCIIHWLDPLRFWGLLEDDYLEIDILSEHGNSGCPVCRRVFFPECSVSTMPLVAECLSFCDMAYASAGVARSEKEERTRKYLWLYVDYCRSIDEHILPFDIKVHLHKCAQKLLLQFAAQLKTQPLTPVQKELRIKLKRIGRKDLDKCIFENDTYIFDIDSNDNERVEFEDNPMGTDKDWETGSDELESESEESEEHESDEEEAESEESEEL
ncbi:hypothetical protein MMC07_002472 [Pseudocyphellaria aurata]|nr:hypothetical protein [Pseudocyphellaria aurata]